MERLKATIIDMQPIDPPVGGGRLRLLGLYSALGAELEAVYVGSYDWRGEKYRDHWISNSLREIDVPLSEEHFSAHDELKRKMGKGCIDTSFPMLGHLSTEMIERAQKEAAEADIVVFSHPWLFPLVAPVLDCRTQLLVYDSQNCEGLLRCHLLDDGTELARQVCREAVRTECEMCHAAHMVLACSQEDKDAFVRLYGIDADKVVITPNGVFTDQIRPCAEEKKRALREKLGLNRFAACFIGSNYGPNVEAGWLVLEAAKRLPQVQFVLIGGVGNSFQELSHDEYPNVIVTGFVEEEEKIDYLSACDIAINPMISGSGTNIKMFDFMAAGLPIITTPTGARGIPNTNGEVYILCEENSNSLAECILDLMENHGCRGELSVKGRAEAEQRYSWEAISYELGFRLKQWYYEKVEKKRPFFSVVIPSYERHDSLTRLMDQLSVQSTQDFEVIIVDQSREVWPEAEAYPQLDMLYYKSRIKGATKARNLGIRLARGHVVAFIDDDCIPEPGWLENARRYFEDAETVGLEGKIFADIHDPSKYRIVNNVNFEGIGFMTANLLARRDILRQIGGFDEVFDNPHFREDTDIGWRLLDCGKVPYASDVAVLHPSHPRGKQRESSEERNKFYVHDPLLLKKDPERFLQLFLMEGHYKETAYWDYFRKGMERHALPRTMVMELVRKSGIDEEYIPAWLR